MDESKSTAGPLRTLLVTLALVLVVAAILAASAFAGGGSSSSGDSASNDAPAASLVQDEEGQAPDAEDCPERSDDAGGNDDASADI
jgi:hypothetical protein